MTETAETPGAMTAEEHMAQARRFAASAETCRSGLDRSVDLQAAQVHATLAQTLTSAEAMPLLAALVESVASGPRSRPEAPAHEEPDVSGGSCCTGCGDGCGCGGSPHGETSEGNDR